MKLHRFVTVFALIYPSVNSQSNIYNTTDCLSLSNFPAWTVLNPQYSNATSSVQIVGPRIGRILIMLIKNNAAEFTVRCPGDLTRDPYSPKTVFQASCSTDFRGYYFPPKDAVSEVWMDARFDERSYGLDFTQTWWCRESADQPLYNVTAIGNGILFSDSECGAALWGTQYFAGQVNITGEVVSRQVHT